MGRLGCRLSNFQARVWSLVSSLPVGRQGFSHMKIEGIKIIKLDERGVIYDCGKSGFISRKEGTISANHVHEDAETVYLVKGNVELTTGEETQVVEAPVKFTTGPNVYHKLVALTDIELVIDREGEKA
mgnify:CR=1 FL=1